MKTIYKYLNKVHWSSILSYNNLQPDTIHVSWTTTKKQMMQIYSASLPGTSQPPMFPRSWHTQYAIFLPSNAVHYFLYQEHFLQSSYFTQVKFRIITGIYLNQCSYDLIHRLSRRSPHQHIPCRIRLFFYATAAI